MTDTKRGARVLDLFTRKGAPSLKQNANIAVELVKTPEYAEARARPSTIVKRKKHHPRRR